ncbi:MAG: hypothetical protein ISS55_10315 [Dehalococcoidales bacterium]|nr:hypothetical protein [Dehalococcoidales bacterium]
MFNEGIKAKDIEFIRFFRTAFGRGEVTDWLEKNPERIILGINFVPVNQATAFDTILILKK